MKHLTGFDHYRCPKSCDHEVKKVIRITTLLKAPSFPKHGHSSCSTPLYGGQGDLSWPFKAFADVRSKTTPSFFPKNRNALTNKQTSQLDPFNHSACLTLLDPFNQLACLTLLGPFNQLACLTSLEPLMLVMSEMGERVGGHD